MRTVKIAPSEIGWLRADCERCLHRQIAHGVRRPGGPPDVYNLADRAMKARFDGGADERHDLGVGPGFRIVAQGLHVESSPVVFPEHDLALVIRGRLDALVRTDEDAIYLVDYKTVVREELPARVYAPQLGAYALALEAPARPEDRVEVDGLALLVYRPDAFQYRTASRVAGLYGRSEWVDVERDDATFVALLRRVAAIVAGAEQPVPNPKCAFCIYYGAVPLVVGAA